MYVDFCVSGVRPHERFEAWSETIAASVGVSVQPPAERAAPFAAAFQARVRGPLGYCNIAADAHRVHRRPQDIARRSHDSYCIYREASTGAWWRQGGRELVTRTGDLLLTDIDAPFETISEDRYAHQAWAIPKAMLTPHLPALSAPLSVVLSSRCGVATLAASYLRAVTETWDELSEPAMYSATDTLCRLIGVACGTAVAEHPEAVREGRLAAARRYVDKHLAEPGLTPATVAKALGISVRGLHLLFEPGGTSFARHVLRRRLDECRLALLANPARPVVDIAFAWGFRSLSSFYGAFQAEFGMAPRDVRFSAAPAASRPGRARASAAPAMR